VKQSVVYPHFDTQLLLWTSFLFPDVEEEEGEGEEKN